MTILHLDFETRSMVDLLTQGAYKYAAHPSTKIICMAWAFDEDEPQLWWPGDPFPKNVALHMQYGDTRSIYAHNSQFERLITRYCLKIEVALGAALDAWYCTAAQARARALPGNLDDLGRALDLPLQKDKRGKELMRLLSMPRTGNKVDYEHGELVNLADYPDELMEYGDYCLRDVVVERAAATASVELSDDEFEDFLVSERINDRGVPIDVPFCRQAQSYAAEEAAEIGELLANLTDGEITTARQFARIKTWLTPYMEQNDALRHAVTRYVTDRRTGETEKKISVDKSSRHDILNAPEGTYPAIVLDLVDLLDEAGRSSVAKYKALEARADAEGIVRGAYMFCGAGQTQRFSSTGAQFHNFSRRVAEKPYEVHDLIMGDLEIDNVLDTLASMLRPTVIA